MSESIKCAIYARYSSNNQREASIEDQIRKCKEFAFSKGWEVLENHIYFDKAQSGTNIESRESFRKMLKTAMSEDSPFKRILVDDTSRIARNTKEALDIFSLLSFYGVYVYYVAQGIDTAYEYAEEMITINGLIDSLYIRNLAKETHRGIEGQVLKGYSAGGRRYGYRSVPVYNGKVDIYGNPEAVGYILKIVPDEAETILRIFKLFAEKGYSAKKIVNLLNKEYKITGKPKPPRGAYWTVSTIIGSKKAFRGILNNEIYIGKYTWNKTSNKRNPVNGKKKLIIREQDKWVTIDKPELRIIPDELWERVKKRQRQIKESSNGRYTKSKIVFSTNLFTGIMKCNTCGGNIVVVSGGKYGKYGCSNNWNKGPSVCVNNLKVDKKIIEEIIIKRLNLNFIDRECVFYLLNKINTKIKNKIKERLKSDVLKDELVRLNKEIENFINAIKAGIISDAVKKGLETAEKKKKYLEQKLETLEKEKPPFTISEHMVIQYLQDIYSTLNLNPFMGRIFISKIIDKIFLKPMINAMEVKIFCKKNDVINLFLQNLSAGQRKTYKVINSIDQKVLTAVAS